MLSLRIVDLLLHLPNQIGKGVRQGCILSPCLFNFYADYIMRDAGLEEAQAGIKITGEIFNSINVPNTM